MIDLLVPNLHMQQIARIMLLQSGPLTEFGELEEGDQIVILRCNIDIDKIIIVASFGSEIRQFTLKIQRA